MPEPRSAPASHRAGCQTPTLRKRRPRALRVFEMIGRPWIARNERAKGGWSRRWVSEIPSLEHGS